MDKLKAVMQNKVSRRKFIRGVSAGAGVAAAVGLAAGCGGNGINASATPPTVPTPALNDTDILNFALNLEYLEAEFYLRAVTGSGLQAADIGANPGAVTGGAQVAFANPAVQAYAMEIANHEQEHVRFLRSALGPAAVDRPAIDLTASFNAAAMAAGLGATFNPFANDNNFVIGAFTFEDVGVTAYNGAGPLLTDKKTNLPAAGSIVAVEAYHAGLIRTLIAYLDDGTATGTIALANAISALRGKASAAVVGANGASGAAETPVSSMGNVSIVAADGNSLAYNRTTDQVLHIVYLNPTAGPVSKGGFFPNGLNGNIAASAS